MIKSTNPYLLIPQRLCMDVRDNPLAIGVYSLIARLFLVSHAAIPLSASDIQRFDTSVSYGQARRALERLVDTGWLAVTLGRKNSYLPTWGRIHGSCRPWQFGVEKFGRPPHVRVYRIEADQIDGMGYLTPHTTSTALVVAGNTTTTLSNLGIQVLIHAGLRTTNLIDQVIDPPIDQPSPTQPPATASECPKEDLAANPAIPWESWDSNQLINQPSSERCELPAETQERGVSSVQQEKSETSRQPVSATKLDSTLLEGHQKLNHGRILLPGEWFELTALQQTYGIEQLLIWQARAQRRQNPIERITPDYYRACASQDAAEQIHQAKAAKRTTKPRATRKAPVANEQPATPPEALSEQYKSHLDALGIKIHTGMEACDPALLAAWVAASTHPDWALYWDDPGAAARAMLLQGKEPPRAALIERRAAAKQQGQPVDWSRVVAQSGGLARLGSDLAGVEEERQGDGTAENPLAACPEQSRRDSRYSSQEGGSDSLVVPDSLETDTLEDQLRMALRLYAPTRPQYQAVERLWLRQAADGIQVCAGRAEDELFLRSLVPVMTRVLGQKPSVTAYVC
jgi:hypothetical protein